MSPSQPPYYPRPVDPSNPLECPICNENVKTPTVPPSREGFICCRCCGYETGDIHDCPVWGESVPHGKSDISSTQDPPSKG